jgi:hypothetical protein
MISGTVKAFEQRCQERGYTLAEVEQCIVSRDGDYLTVDETHPAYPHKRRGLGDMVADGLAAVGITKERVSKAIGRPCGCGKRQEKLNEIGRKLGIG